MPRAKGSITFLIGLVIAITGFIPGQSDPEIILNICWAFIFIGGWGFTWSVSTAVLLLT